MTDPPRVWVAGLGYPEAPHRHGGRLWFSDFLTRRVSSVGRDGEVHTEAYVPGQPSGIGFLGEDLLVVSSYDRKVRRLTGSVVRVHAELAGLANSPLNDMLVLPDGRAYVGTYGVETTYDLGELHPDGLCPAPDGSVWVGCPFEERFVRVAAGGRVLETRPTPGRWAVSCQLDRSSGGLVAATAETTRPDLFRGVSRGALELMMPAGTGG